MAAPGPAAPGAKAGTAMVPHPLDVQLLSDAFELDRATAEVDLATARAWTGSQVELLRWLRRRHAWDGTTATYYLAWLRKLLAR